MHAAGSYSIPPSRSLPQEMVQSIPHLHFSIPKTSACRLREVSIWMLVGQSFLWGSLLCSRHTFPSLLLLFPLFCVDHYYPLLSCPSKGPSRSVLCGQGSLLPLLGKSLSFTARLEFTRVQGQISHSAYNSHSVAFHPIVQILDDQSTLMTHLVEVHRDS